MAYNYQAYVPSAQTNEYKRRQDLATDTYNAFANKGYSQGAGGLGSQLGTAQQRLNALYNGNKLSQQFQYSKQPQYDKALNDISNRKAFSYDLSDDHLFQQAKEQYQVMGKTAMADTIGQASAMTGGYGNSYATSAGQQAYNAHLQQLNNSIGDYYAMALNTYNTETDRLNGVYNALATDRSTQQNEWANNWNVYNQLYSQYSNDYNNLLNQDMSAWQTKGSNLYNSANLATGQYGTASQNDINTWNSQEKLKAEQASQAETERHNREQEAYNNAQLALDRDKYNETVRSNKRNEEIQAQYYSQKDDGNKTTTITPTQSKNTSSIIAQVVGEADSQRFLPKDKQKDTKTIAEKIIKSKASNLTDGELAYLYDYYNL